MSEHTSLRILAILAVLNAFLSFWIWIDSSPQSTLQTQCLHGYVFIVNNNEPRQMIDQDGHGIKCEEG